MFEDRSYENILDELLAMAPDDIDTRQGGIYYNHAAPIAFMISRYYTEMQITVDLISMDTAEGIYLDEKCKEHAVYRVPALPCYRKAIFTGATVAAGMRFFADGYYFKLMYDADGQLLLEAEIGGEAPNTIPTGITLVPVNTIPNLTVATLGEIVTPGTEIENDDNLRRRLREKIAGPAENGNSQHYKSWCESVNGVGLARIDALWNGHNTVRGIIVGTDGLGAAESVVTAVQDFVDPGGFGLGEGAANIGAYFTAVAAANANIDISFNVQLAEGSSLQQVIAATTEELTKYFKAVSLETRDKSNMIIRTSAISNVIYSTPGVVDYTGLTINGATANIVVSFTDAPKLGVLKIEQI